MSIYVYIDESGDLGFHPEKSSTHLIITALFVSDPLKLDRIMKSIRRNAPQKEIKKSFEMKGSKLSETTVKRLLIKLNEIQDIKIVHIIAEKKHLQRYLEKNNKNQLYNIIVGEIAKHIPFEKTGLEIRIDKSKNKKELRDEFNTYFIETLKSYSSCHVIENTIHHNDSKMWSGLQFADILAWSEYQKIALKKDEISNLIDKTKQEEYTFEKQKIKK
jgi:hypothetical protein